MKDGLQDPFPQSQMVFSIPTPEGEGQGPVCSPQMGHQMRPQNSSPGTVIGPVLFGLQRWCCCLVAWFLFFCKWHDSTFKTQDEQPLRKSWIATVGATSSHSTSCLFLRCCCPLTGLGSSRPHPFCPILSISCPALKAWIAHPSPPCPAGFAPSPRPGGVCVSS